MQSSLSAQFGGLLCLSACLSAVLFLLLYTGGGLLLSRYFEASNFRERCVERKIQALQDYVWENDLPAQDAASLTRWVRHNPLILMEIYRDNILLYTSSAPEESSGGASELKSPYYDWVSYYEVTFSDGTAEVVLYANDTYRWFTYRTILSLLLSSLLFLLIFILGSRRLVEYICRLSEQIQAMEGGDLDQAILIQGNHELSRLARGLDSMRRSFREQREREAELFWAHQTMITQMSHDFRTPLTALQIYTDILRYHKFENKRQAMDYLSKIDGKIAQIKQLSDNIFEYSLIARGQQIPLEAPRPVRDIFHDTLSEMAAVLERQGFFFDLDLDWPAASLSVSSQYVKRVADNLVSNLSKYADPVRPIRISVRREADSVLLSFSNTVQPNASRADSHHIGLSCIRAMMEKMGGELRVHAAGSEFQALLLFPVTGEGGTAGRTARSD